MVFLPDAQAAYDGSPFARMSGLRIAVADPQEAAEVASPAEVGCRVPAFFNSGARDTFWYRVDGALIRVQVGERGHRLVTEPLPD